MSRNNQGEKEIILGNGQLLGIFLAAAVLLGVAFTGGYMVGKGTKPAVANPQTSASFPPAESAKANTAIGETHSIPASPASSAAPSDSSEAANARELPGLTRRLAPEEHAQAAEVRTSDSVEDLTPVRGESFLQVAAVSRDEADEVADVLRKKGFRAHAVRKPGKPKVYRVLIGPIRSKSELSTTRDALRRTGFSDVITQRY